MVIRTHLLDASALVKLLLVEEGSEAVKKYESIGSVFWTTSFCVAETLGVLKSKHKRGKITKEKYLAAADNFISQLRC